jgi:hypothetical protein
VVTHEKTAGTALFPAIRGPLRYLPVMLVMDLMHEVCRGRQPGAERPWFLYAFQVIERVFKNVPQACAGRQHGRDSDRNGQFVTRLGKKKPGRKAPAVSLDLPGSSSRTSGWILTLASATCAAPTRIGPSGGGASPPWLPPSPFLAQATPSLENDHPWSSSW